MKKLSLFIISLSLFATGSMSMRGQDELEEARKRWLFDRYVEATSIKPGMSRADLFRVFKEDGGLQRIPATRYILKSCDMIQVEVEFNTEYGQAYKEKPDTELKITKVSQPYLKLSASD